MLCTGFTLDCLIPYFCTLGNTDTTFLHACAFENAMFIENSVCHSCFQCLLFQFSFSFKHSCWSCLTAKTLENETT